MSETVDLATAIGTMSAPTMADEELMTDEELAALSDSQLGDIILGLCYSGSVDAIADLLKFRPSVTTYQTDGEFPLCTLHAAETTKLPLKTS